MHCCPLTGQQLTNKHNNIKNTLHNLKKHDNLYIRFVDKVILYEKVIDLTDWLILSNLQYVQTTEKDKCNTYAVIYIRIYFCVQTFGHKYIYI